MRCIRCGAELYGGSFCPRCGMRNTPQDIMTSDRQLRMQRRRKREKKRRTLRTLGLLFMLLLLAGAAFTMLSKRVQSANEPPAESAPAAMAEQPVNETVLPTESAAVTEAASAAEPAVSSGEEVYYAYYALLNDNEKIVYQQIIEAAEQGVEEVTPSVNITLDEYSEAADAVYLDQPQLFWLTNSWTRYYNESSNYVTSAVTEYNELADNLEANIAVFNKAAESVLSGLDGMTDAEKEKAIHDYLVSSVDYSSGALDQTAFGALVNHTGVCEAYAKAFQYLMQQAGIPTYVAEGTSLDSQTGTWEGHAWNIVKLGDGYYDVDVTWDDPSGDAGGYIYYTYYNRTDADFSARHERDDSSAALPVCNSTEYSYESLYGLPAELGVTTQMGLTRNEPITSLDNFYEALKEDLSAAGTGTHTFGYAISGADVENAISDAINSGDIHTYVTRPSAEAIGMNGYSTSYDCETMELGSGYYYYSFTITLN